MAIIPPRPNLVVDNLHVGAVLAFKDVYYVNVKLEMKHFIIRCAARG
jgi:hypothetical protein